MDAQTTLFGNLIRYTINILLNISNEYVTHISYNYHASHSLQFKKSLIVLWGCGVVRVVIYLIT